MLDSEPIFEWSRFERNPKVRSIYNSVDMADMVKDMSGSDVTILVKKDRLQSLCFSRAQSLEERADRREKLAEEMKKLEAEQRTREREIRDQVGNSYIAARPISSHLDGYEEDRMLPDFVKMRRQAKALRFYAENLDKETYVLNVEDRLLQELLS